MAITAAQVKELREMSGAGMMDCKKALTATNGNMEEAIDFLRKNGAMKAEKKASRITAEGLSYILMDGDKKAAVVEVNSETDFAAKGDKFQNFVKNVAQQVLGSDATTVDELLAEPWFADASKTVKDELVSQIAVISENLSIRRFQKVTTDGLLVPYIHGGGRVAVLVEADTDVINDDIKDAMKNVAMQVAAMHPKYTTQDEIPADFIEHEKEILIANAKEDPKNANKPDNIIERMISGRLNKEFKEIVLVDQEYVKDGDFTVGKYVAKVGKDNGANLSVKNFIRFETGEGIEKKQENFAEEVAKQMQ